MEDKEKKSSGLMYVIGGCPECHNMFSELKDPFIEGHSPDCKGAQDGNDKDV